MKKLNNGEKSVIFCRLLQMIETTKGIVDFQTFCTRECISMEFLFKEVFLVNSFIKDMCESVGTFDDKSKFAQYYSMSLKDALFVLDMYNKSNLIIKLG